MDNGAGSAHMPGCLDIDNSSTLLEVVVISGCLSDEEEGEEVFRPPKNRTDLGDFYSPPSQFCRYQLESLGTFCFSCCP